MDPWHLQAGQDILQAEVDLGKDPSGNPILKDVGTWLKKQLKVGSFNGNSMDYGVP